MVRVDLLTVPLLLLMVELVDIPNLRPLRRHFNCGLHWVEQPGRSPYLHGVAETVEV